MRPPLDDPRWTHVRLGADKLSDMAAWPIVYCPEEVLGQALAVACLAFDLAGSGHDETQRRALHDALRDYVDVPAPVSQAQAA